MIQRVLPVSRGYDHGSRAIAHVAQAVEDVANENVVRVLEVVVHPRHDHQRNGFERAAEI